MGDAKDPDSERTHSSRSSGSSVLPAHQPHKVDELMSIWGEYGDHLPDSRPFFLQTHLLTSLLFHSHLQLQRGELQQEISPRSCAESVSGFVYFSNLKVRLRMCKCCPPKKRNHMVCNYSVCERLCGCETILSYNLCIRFNMQVKCVLCICVYTCRTWQIMACDDEMIAKSSREDDERVQVFAPTACSNLLHLGSHTRDHRHRETIVLQGLL